MPPSLLAFVISAAAYAGFQWTVHLVVYRQFPVVAPQDFPAYERSHQRLISPLVGPLFAGLIASAGWLAWARPPRVPAVVLFGVCGVVAAILLLTGLAAVPLHRRLSTGWDPRAHRALLRVDLVRSLLATAGVVLGAVPGFVG